MYYEGKASGITAQSVLPSTVSDYLILENKVIKCLGHSMPRHVGRFRFIETSEDVCHVLAVDGSALVVQYVSENANQW